MNERREIELLAGIVHGVLFFGHILGIVYNCKRRNWKQATVHAVAIAFDGHAAIQHLKDAKNDTKGTSEGN